jgi:predicted PurR-regulated permease PerM
MISMLSRIFVWGSLFGVLYLLRSFSLLIFLIFIFSYIQTNAVGKLEPYIKRRTPRVVVVGVSFLAVFILMLALLLPQIKDQAVHFIANSTRYAQSLDTEVVKLTIRYPALEDMLPEIVPEHTVPLPDSGEWEFRNSTLSRVLQALFGSERSSVDKKSLVSVFQTARDIGSSLLAVSSQFLLSLLFSFLIVLDLPNLKKGAMSLRNTKLRFVYDEMADNLVRFGMTMGRAFEAQFQVALINTLLTAAGVWMLNIRDQMAFLSLIVFLCGFIPIAGVFISSVPICLLALAGGGMPKLLLAIVLIVAVHAIESYILNPRIFGTHMKLNPVVVMILMTVSGKLFGVWGLVLCLPITTYLFQDAIQLTEQAKPKIEPEAGEPSYEASLIGTDGETEVPMSEALVE